MAGATVLFLIIGGVGIVLLTLSLLGVELLDLDGFVPLEVVAAMMGTFGFAAAIASSLLGGRAGPALLGAAVIGAVASLPAGWLTLRLVRAARQMQTDATPTRDDLLGSMGLVVTPIPERGYGEVRVTLGGQPVKLNATADSAIPLGAQIFVIAAPSETSVVVEQLSATGNPPPATRRDAPPPPADEPSPADPSPHN
jgi:membrane-bound ClpP family serine protease